MCIRDRCRCGRLHTRSSDCSLQQRTKGSTERGAAAAPLHTKLHRPHLCTWILPSSVRYASCNHPTVGAHTIDNNCMRLVSIIVYRIALSYKDIFSLPSLLQRRSYFKLYSQPISYLITICSSLMVSSCTILLLTEGCITI